MPKGFFVVLFPLIILQLVLQITALINLWKSGKEVGIKIVWTMAIALFGLVGPIVYFFTMRKKS